MEQLTTLLLENPSAVIESGAVIPCSLQDLLRVSLEDANGLPLRVMGFATSKAGRNGNRVDGCNLRV